MTEEKQTNKPDHSTALAVLELGCGLEAFLIWDQRGFETNLLIKLSTEPTDDTHVAPSRGSAASTQRSQQSLIMRPQYIPSPLYLEHLIDPRTCTGTPSKFKIDMSSSMVPCR